jgi:hypothetical protein
VRRDQLKSKASLMGDFDSLLTSVREIIRRAKFDFTQQVTQEILTNLYILPIL